MKRQDGAANSQGEHGSWLVARFLASHVRGGRLSATIGTGARGPPRAWRERGLLIVRRRLRALLRGSGKEEKRGCSALCLSLAQRARHENVVRRFSRGRVAWRADEYAGRGGARRARRGAGQDSATRIGRRSGRVAAPYRLSSRQARERPPALTPPYWLTRAGPTPLPHLSSLASTKNRALASIDDRLEAVKRAARAGRPPPPDPDDPLALSLLAALPPPPELEALRAGARAVRRGAAKAERHRRIARRAGGLSPWCLPDGAPGVGPWGPRRVALSAPALGGWTEQPGPCCAAAAVAGAANGLLVPAVARAAAATALAAGSPAPPTPRRLTADDVLSLYRERATADARAAARALAGLLPDRPADVGSPWTLADLAPLLEDRLGADTALTGSGARPGVRAVQRALRRAAGLPVVPEPAGGGRGGLDGRGRGRGRGRGGRGRGGGGFDFPVEVLAPPLDAASAPPPSTADFLSPLAPVLPELPPTPPSSSTAVLAALVPAALPEERGEIGPYRVPLDPRDAAALATGAARDSDWSDRGGEAGSSSEGGDDDDDADADDADNADADEDDRIALGTAANGTAPSAPVPPLLPGPLRDALCAALHARPLETSRRARAWCLRRAQHAKLSPPRASTAPVGTDRLIWALGEVRVAAEPDPARALLAATIARDVGTSNGVDGSPPRLRARRLMGAGRGSRHVITVDDDDFAVGRQWQAVWSTVACLDSVCLYHLENHYSMVYAVREWESPRSYRPGEGDLDPAEPAVIVQRQLLVARPGQRPSIWVDFASLRETCLGWRGYGLIEATTRGTWPSEGAEPEPQTGPIGGGGGGGGQGTTQTWAPAEAAAAGAMLIT